MSLNSAQGTDQSRAINMVPHSHFTISCAIAVINMAPEKFHCNLGAVVERSSL